MNLYNWCCTRILFVGLEEALRGSENWLKLAFVRTGYLRFHICSIEQPRNDLGAWLRLIIRVQNRKKRACSWRDARKMKDTLNSALQDVTISMSALPLFGANGSMNVFPCEQAVTGNVGPPISPWHLLWRNFAYRDFLTLAPRPPSDACSTERNPQGYLL